MNFEHYIYSTCVQFEHYTNHI